MPGRQVGPSVGARTNFGLDQVAPSRLERGTAEGRGRDAGPSGIRRVQGEWLIASHTPSRSNTMHWIPITQLCRRRERRNTLATTVLFSCLLALCGVEGLEIKDFKVPTVVESGSTEPLILDCNYDYEEVEKSSIVVKWFHETGPKDNKTSLLVYQWIATNPPQALASLKYHLDIHYEASSDPHTKHRALSIVNPTVNLTGEYKCHVSSNYGDDIKSQRMIVYSPAKDSNLKVVSSLNRVNVTCFGYGLFPQPNVDITVNDSVLAVIDNKTDVILKEEGLYDIVGYRLFQYNPAKLRDTTFECVLSVPETAYVVRIESVFSPTLQDTDPIPEANSAKSKQSDKNKESSLTDTRPEHADSTNGNWQSHRRDSTLLSISSILLICLWTLVV